ncbi:flagellar protein FliT [Chitinolyticbacter meiyuanensis]|uniref:flagellar protein FliT n=1 Tax=Chitinolyticbacter meiyuanensis TaxID=682798 RepID=UPI001651C037|nr:flagellar protein FliT [Chitinolyticbacter meiyuanensis]
MARPDIGHTLRALHVLARQMLADAREQRWDDLLERQPIWLALHEALHSVDWAAYPEEERQALSVLMEGLQSSIAELTALAEAWKPELQSMMNVLQNSSKLDRAYRV